MKVRFVVLVAKGLNALKLEPQTANPFSPLPSGLFCATVEPDAAFWAVGLVTVRPHRKPSISGFVQRFSKRTANAHVVLPIVVSPEGHLPVTLALIDALNEEAFLIQFSNTFFNHFGVPLAYAR